MSGGGAIVAYPLFQTEDGGASPTSPLQFEIHEISTKSACELNLQWHSRLPKITNPHSGHTVCFGAMFGDRWYACAIWTDPIARLFNGKGYLELRRMAISSEAPKNTASRMISVMTKKIRNKFPDIVKLISYQDTDVHLGTIYKASGWREFKGSSGIGWNSRKRGITQAPGLKIRWEKDL